LLENGSDLRFILNLLGDTGPKTTEIYAPVAVNSSGSRKNPLDLN